MYRNKGFEMENEMVEKINNKLYDQLGNNIKNIIKMCFKSISLQDPFYCFKCPKGRKPDICITHKEQSVLVSLKTGNSESVHEETIQSFIQFLRDHNISNDTLKTILLFQYGDMTLNGTGKVRYCYSELFPKLVKRIVVANKELNANKDLVLHTMQRFIFDGWGDDDLKADAIYHGSCEYGVICTKKQLETYVVTKNFTRFENLHIGPFMFFPKARYIDFNDVNPAYRHKINVKWTGIQGDLTYITDRYDY